MRFAICMPTPSSFSSKLPIPRIRMVFIMDDCVR
jgi:hypothetical protein